MIKSSDRIVEGRWFCTQCGYKSHWIKENFTYFIHKLRYFPKRECVASKALDYEIKKYFFSFRNFNSKSN